MTESDGVNEVVQGGIIAALTAAASAASMAAQARADRLHKAAANQDAELHQLEAQFDSERKLAIAELRSVEHQDQLSADQAARAWRLAETWQHEPEFGQVRDALAKRIQAEFGADPRDQRTVTDLAATSVVVSSVVQAEATDRAAWDSVERRQQSAAQMNEAEVPEQLVAAAAVADLANATPPTAAVTKPRVGARSVARSHGPQKGLDLQR